MSAEQLEKLRDEFEQRKAEIRRNSAKSWEAKEREVRRLGLRFDRERKRLEQEEVEG